MIHKPLPSIFSYLLLIWVIFSFTSMNAQNLQFLKKKIPPDWETNPIYSADIEPIFADEDAVILKEAVSWKMNDQENTTLFHCNKKIYFATQAGIDQHSTISLPENIDPSYEYADLPMAERAETHRPKYFNLEILYFEARILKPNGSVELLQTNHRVESEQLKFDLQEWKAYAYHFELPKNSIEAGDIIEISYLYYLPFIFDWRRQFFHSFLPKQSFELTISHPSRMVMVFDYTNDTEPNTLIKDQEKPYWTSRQWKLQNLEGCTGEVGTRLYRDLPHITFYVHNKAFGDWNNDHITRYKPYTWRYFTKELIGFRKYNERSIGGFTINRKEWMLDNFYKDFGGGYSQKNPLEKLYSIHTAITDEFGYQQDVDHYANTDMRIGKLPESLRERLTQDMHRNVLYRGVFNNRLVQSPYRTFSTEDYFGLTDSQRESLPKYLKLKVLRTASRNTLYQGILNRLQEDYYQVHLSDKRVGEIHSNICLPIIGDNQLFAVETDKNMHYVYPKKDRFGYALNELPFYLQHASGLHIFQMTDSYKNDKNILFKPTPQNKASDNFRYNHVLAKVDLETTLVHFEADVNLSGQYSTMMRGFYQYEAIDSSVNERYSHHISDLNENAKIHRQKTEYEPVYPFKATALCDYTVPNLITAVSDTSFELNLYKWVYHIYHDGFEAKNRDLPYYPDFIGRDTYTYQIEFEQPIAIKPFKDLPLILENDFAKYIFSIEQKDDYTLLIRSDLTVKTDQVLPKKADEVALIYGAMKEVEAARILVRVK
ncbi:MAG: hypothetical protein R3E32_21550 [Chitinophagales bacterium]